MLNVDKLTTDKIYQALAQIKNPDTGRDLVSSAMISGLQIVGKNEVIFSIVVDPARGSALEPMRQEAEKIVAGLKGVKKVTAILTAEKMAEAPVRMQANSDPHGMEKNPKLKLHVKHIVVVSSGKGGVGKSTIASNLAYVLADSSQLKIGLLDADIYGPSQPKMMGLEGHKPEFNDEKKIIPPSVHAGAHGLKVMSIGFMVDASKALVWRGPMVQSAIYQLFRDVEWGSAEQPLDILIVDMPPGTGDAQLTIAQKVDVAGAVIVSTPQDIALIDARKGIEMFKATNVPILGIVENMSTHVCSNCGHEEHIFGHGGARAEAEKLGVPFLGEIPLSLEIREKSDQGVRVAGVFDEMASQIAKLLKL